MIVFIDFQLCSLLPSTQTYATHQQNYIGMRLFQEYRLFLELTFMLIYNSSMIINE
nr:MAG TPA: hypothetical protein [Caudoviricetes sp.]